MPFAKTNGINLYYEEHGKGDPLLLIMGITAPGSVWEKHLNVWKNYFRCIVVDNRGVGNSDKPAGDYTTVQMADDYIGLLNFLGIEIVKVVGVSMGSTIAQQLCLRDPKRIQAAVLMCPWARCDRTAEAIFQHLVAIKGALPANEFMRYIQLLIFSKASWDSSTAYEEMLLARQDALTDLNPQPLEALASQAAACVNHDLLNELPKISQPCLVIGGKEDIFTPAWMAHEVANAIPHSQLHLYEKSGHAFHWENLEDFNSRVHDWLKMN
jgi:pimeloyl-ACP methyl ester carboxylesterase